MLNDNSLGDRLNAVKEGKPVPKLPTQSLYPNIPQDIAKPSSRVVWLGKSIQLFDISLVSFLYGFAIKTILFLDWSLIGVFAVGFLMNSILTIWPKYIFPKFFKNKI